MPTTTTQILKAVLGKYPEKQKQHISNCSDKNIEGRIDTFHQYIFGVIPYVSFGPGSIERYSDNIRQRLGNLPAELAISPWPFAEYEINELRTVLQDLSNHFQANLNVNEMVDHAIRTKAEHYYIIITIIRTPVVYVQ